ncbi:MAG: hypothetical protein QOJ50_4020 [Cryptosporangiaceae bacterium]|nr:hypothetical protein [Cryptosporangiaceae bacterium]
MTRRSAGGAVAPLTSRERYDVVVAGAGPAGLSAAVALARARRSVLVVDSGTPRNAPSAAIHGFLTRDGMSPAEFAAAGRDELRGYGGEIADGHAVSAAGAPDEFSVTLRTGDQVLARRLLVTTGLTDELPALAGLGQRWGRDVLHCPYCHGWEVRDQALGIIGTSAQAVELAVTWRQWSADVVLFQHSAPSPDDAEAALLAALGVRTVRGHVAGLVSTGGRLTGVRLRGGTLVGRDAVVVQPCSVARSELLVSLGLELTRDPSGAYVPTTRTGLTAVPGVWAAGNVADPSAKVVAAAAAGLAAAMDISNNLILGDAASALLRALPRHPAAR